MILVLYKNESEFTEGFPINSMCNGQFLVKIVHSIIVYREVPLKVQRHFSINKINCNGKIIQKNPKNSDNIALKFHTQARRRATRDLFSYTPKWRQTICYRIIIFPNQDVLVSKKFAYTSPIASHTSQSPKQFFVATILNNDASQKKKHETRSLPRTIPTRIIPATHSGMPDPRKTKRTENRDKFRNCIKAGGCVRKIFPSLSVAGVIF